MGNARFRVDTKAVERMLGSARDALDPPRITEAVRAAAETFREGIAGRAPRQSGRLAASFEVETLSATEAQAVSGLVYARPQEAGAFIKPKAKKILKLSTGAMQFQKFVRIKPQPYVAPTFAADADKAFDAFADHVERGISR